MFTRVEELGIYTLRQIDYITKGVSMNNRMKIKPFLALGICALFLGIAPYVARAGGDVSGGGNGIENRMIESYAHDVFEIPGYVEFVQPILKDLAMRVPHFAAVLEHHQREMIFYIVPRKLLKQLKPEETGIPIASDQIAIQTSGNEVWINKSLFDALSKQDKGKLLFHELILNLTREDEFSDPDMRLVRTTTAYLFKHSKDSANEVADTLDKLGWFRRYGTNLGSMTKLLEYREITRTAFTTFFEKFRQSCSTVANLAPESSSDWAKLPGEQKERLKVTWQNLARTQQETIARLWGFYYNESYRVEVLRSLTSRGYSTLAYANYDVDSLFMEPEHVLMMSFGDPAHGDGDVVGAVLGPDALLGDLEGLDGQHLQGRVPRHQ